VCHPARLGLAESLVLAVRVFVPVLVGGVGGWGLIQRVVGTLVMWGATDTLALGGSC